jgi:hypothetical protein
MHAGSLLACWLSFDQVGLGFIFLTHWVTIVNFMSLYIISIPRLRIYLGTSNKAYRNCVKNNWLKAGKKVLLVIQAKKCRPFPEKARCNQ